MIKNFLFLLFLGFTECITIRQYSDEACTILSRTQKVPDNNCFSLASTSSYLIKACNCTMIEYDLYSGAMCFGNFIGKFYTQQNVCLSTRQIISCYEDYSNSNQLNAFFSIIFTFITFLI